jgi:hypothetical protein
VKDPVTGRRTWRGHGLLWWTAMAILAYVIVAGFVACAGALMVYG